jgi:hypothetical protein
MHRGPAPRSPAGCFLNTQPAKQVHSWPTLKRANANASACLWLGSPKDLGLLFIRPHETCYCCSCLELCQLRASSLQWVRAPPLCRGQGGSPSATLHLFGLRSSLFRRSTRPCWPCCGRAGLLGCRLLGHGNSRHCPHGGAAGAAGGWSRWRAREDMPRRSLAPELTAPPGPPARPAIPPWTCRGKRTTNTTWLSRS